MRDLTAALTRQLSKALSARFKAEAGLSAARSALEPFAKEADMWGEQVPDDHRPVYVEMGHNDARYFGSPSVFTLADLRRAKSIVATLAQEPAGQSEADNMAGVAEQSGAGAPETSVRCGAPAALTTAPQSEVQDIRWAVNYLLEQIAGKLADWPTHDIWRSEAADLVRSFKHDLSQAPQSPGGTGDVATMRDALGVIARTTFSGNEMGDEYRRGNEDAHQTCRRLALAALAAHPTVKVSGDAAEMRERCIEAARRVGNFGDYAREELTTDYGQPKFDMMHAIIDAIRALPLTPEGRS